MQQQVIINNENYSCSSTKQNSIYSEKVQWNYVSQTIIASDNCIWDAIAENYIEQRKQ